MNTDTATDTPANKIQKAELFRHVDSDEYLLGAFKTLNIIEMLIQSCHFNEII